MDSDGGNPAFLANGISPNWSPDGSKIVFTDGAGSSSEIIVMDANGSNRTPLTNDSVVDRDPAWSPDGQKIVFAHGRVIYTMNANGTAMAQLVTQSFGEESQSAPDWQPLLGPQRGDYRNAAQFCKAERSFLGDAAFVKKYGTNENGANAYSKCVSGS